METKQIDIKLCTSLLRWHGRCFEDDGITWMNHTCCGFETIFTGRYLAADFTTTPAQPDDMANAWIGVFADDMEQPTQIVELYQATTRVVLADFDAPKTVRIRVALRSEQQHHPCGVQVLMADARATLAAPAKKACYLSFVGDSYTAGFGDEAPHPDSAFHTKEENGWLAWPALTARALDADWVTVAWSGIGMAYFNSADPENPGREPLISDLFPYTDRKHDLEKHRPLTLWQDERQPDAVIINLGTNDTTCTRDREDRRREYIRCYKSFLLGMRARYPQAVIYCVLGPLLDESQVLLERLKALVAQLQAEGDKRLYVQGFAAIRPEEGMGAGHPTVVTHRRLAADFAPMLAAAILAAKEGQ